MRCRAHCRCAREGWIVEAPSRLEDVTDARGSDASSTGCAASSSQGERAGAGVAKKRKTSGTSGEAARGVYFEEQDDAWCGMHALNHFLGGPYVTKPDCKAAARQIAEQLSQVAGGDREDLAQHLHPDTGWLSIDVINRLGSTRPEPFHVDEASVPWEVLQHVGSCAALVNWSNQHWTLLERDAEAGMWRHTNSFLGPGLRHGRRTDLASPKIVQDLLDEIVAQCGSVSLHRIGQAVEDGSQFLEAAGLRASAPPDIFAGDQPEAPLAGSASVGGVGARNEAM